MNKRTFQYISTFLFSFLLFHYSYCQTASISGKVFNAKNKDGLTGAVVSIVKLHIEKTTGNNGSYFIDAVPAGDYDIKIEFVGYSSLTKHIRLSIDEHLKLDIALDEKLSALNDVHVFSKINGDDETSSRKSEKNANNITNVISAQAMQRSPDINAANVLQRMSGVTIQRNSGGDEAYAVIRGVEPRYNNTLINGVKIASPDEKSRFISLDVVPSDLLQRIEVSKSLTPSMEGDAIGGTVNLVFKDAPDSTSFRVSGAIGYGSIFFSRKYTSFSRKDIYQHSVYERFGPSYVAQPKDFSRSNLDFKQVTALPTGTFDISYGKRFLHNKLGVLIADNFQNQYYGSNSAFNNAQSSPATGKPYITDVANRTYSNQQLNNGITVHADYNFNDRNKISLSNVFLYSSFAQARLSIDTAFVGGSGGRTVPGTGPVSNNYRSVTNHQFLENLKLEGKHILSGHLLFDWAGVISSAVKKAPDRAELSTDKTIRIESDGTRFETPYYYDGTTHIWQHNEDKDYNLLANLTYKTKWGSSLTEIKAGGLYRHKERNNRQNEYDLKPVGNQGNNGSKPLFTDIYSVQDTVYDPKGSAAYDVNNYHAFEDISAGFLQAKFVLEKFDLTGGVRIEHTSQGYHYLNFIPTAIDNVKKMYTDYLPSVHFRYKLNDKTDIRASYFRSIARPGYYELVPYTIHGNNGYDEKGNPALQHTTADNYDLRYELFPKQEEQLFIGGFYKNLQKPIENAFTGFGGGQINFMPTNTAANAKLYGGELVYTKYFGNIGITGNYAYTYSDIYAQKVDVTTGKPVYQHRPLQGQSDNELNASVEYKNDRKKFFVQLAYQYIGKTLSNVYANLGYDYYQQPQSFLALSANKQINRHFNIFGKFNNLLNTPTTIKISDLTIGRDISKSSMMIGLRYYN